MRNTIMLPLSASEIELFSKRRGVKKLAVENFLGSLYGTRQDCINNAWFDSKSYRWNEATQRAILEGIDYAFGK